MINSSSNGDTNSVPHSRLFVPKYGLEVSVGTHPIPEKYVGRHQHCGKWSDAKWDALLQPAVADEATRKAYDQE